MIYTICTYLWIIGILGLIAQFLVGVSHGGHSGGHGHAAGHGHGQAHGHAGRGSSGRTPSALGLLMTFLSPLMLFSVSLGAGAGGLLLKPLHLPVYEIATAAALCGISLYAAAVRPIWQLLFRFASEPSAGLEGAIGKDAEVVRGFDTSGRGLVKLTIDGQIANNILAHLDDSDKDRPEEIHAGDILTVTSVDTHNNTCRVARL